jgi:tetrapyrrole methylase family protein/MazG family protein
VSKAGGISHFPLDPLVELMDRLLAPDGCPWDRAQDHRSLRSFVIEEAYEVVGAIDGGDAGKLKDELGDLLLQVVFHAALAQREGTFDVNDVVASITAKLRRRHPHVFGLSRVKSAKGVLRQWEDIKKAEAAEPAEASEPGDGVRLEAHLPALMQAQKLLERGARLGRSWPDLAEEAGDRAPEEAGGRAPEATGGHVPEAELGRALLALLERARLEGLDAELCLRQACARLARRLDAPGA